MAEPHYISIPQLAKLLGVSRIAIYKKVKAGQIPAKKIGRDYAITDQIVSEILGSHVTEQRKRVIDEAVAKTVREYGDVLKRLSKE